MDNTDDQFSLKWNNFQSNLATGFHDLLQEEMMVDVTLAAEGKFLQAHKIILSVCSPYFKDLFKVNPCKHPIVILKDVGHQEMSDMLDFMYRGEANVRQEDLAAFLKLAETLKVKGLAGDKSGEEEQAPPPPPAPRKSLPQQVPKKKKLIETSVFDSDDHDPGDPDFNPGGGEPRRKKRRSSPPPKTDSVMPSSSSVPFPLANPKQEMPDPEEVQLVEDNDEINDPIAQLIAGQGAKQEHDQDFDDSNFDNTLDETGDGSQENDFDMTAGPSNPDESSDQVPQVEKYYDYQITRTSRGRPKIIAVGYGYIQKAKGNFRNWVCDKRRETKCLVTSTLQEDNGLIITPKHRHTHKPNHIVTKAGENGSNTPWKPYFSTKTLSSDLKSFRGDGHFHPMNLSHQVSNWGASAGEPEVARFIKTEVI